MLAEPNLEASTCRFLDALDEQILFLSELDRLRAITNPTENRAAAHEIFLRFFASESPVRIVLIYISEKNCGSCNG
jgi:hypothetical protein